MSKLDTLISEFCSLGVEHEKLSKVLVIKNGKDYKKLSKGKYPVLGSGGIMTYIDQYAYDRASVLIPRKGSISNLFFIDTPFWTVDTLFYTEINEAKSLPKYIYYCLKKERLENLNTAGGVPSLTQEVLYNVRIPLPPLPVQEEIVRILYKFTALEAELEAELEARKKQYEYYRDLLFDFDKHRDTMILWSTLSQIADIGTGSSNTNEELEVGNYPFFVRSQEVRQKNSYEFDETAIITSGDGVGVGKIFHYVEGKYALHQRAYRIHIKDDRVLPKYFFYYMKSTFLRYIDKNSFHSSVTSIRRPMLNNYPVPVPPLAEQERIVSILDRFDSLVNDITQGLPAEIEARRKQYEYYRNQLLTFKEATP